MWLDDAKYALINTGFRGPKMQSRHMHFRLVADFKLVVGVNLFL